MTAPVHRRRFWVAASLVAAVALLVTGCSSSGGAAPTAAASSSNPSLLPTTPGTVPDSIEDVNSSKDMTGVVTTYSDRDSPKNPYFDLIPYVCPFLPDSFTRGTMGMVDVQNGFPGRHSLLQNCNMNGPSGPNYEQLAVVVGIQATSFSDLMASSDRIILDRDISLGREGNGTLYKNRDDDKPDLNVCNVSWGTFFGSATVSVSVDSGYPADPCAKAREFSPEISRLLPSKPIQMRP